MTEKQLVTMVTAGMAQSESFCNANVWECRPDCLRSLSQAAPKLRLRT